jgi:hypothetical protein
MHAWLRYAYDGIDKVIVTVYVCSIEASTNDCALAFDSGSLGVLIGIYISLLIRGMKGVEGAYSTGH